MAKTFFLRFNDNELKEEFEEMVKMFNRNEKRLEVSKDSATGFYAVSPAEEEMEKNEKKGDVPNEVTWEICMHKYFSYSKSVKKDKFGKKYNPVIFSWFSISMSGNGEAVAI